MMGEEGEKDGDFILNYNFSDTFVFCFFLHPIFSLIHCF